MNFANLFSNINSREVIKHLPDAVFVTDLDGRTVWVNDKASVIFEAKIDNIKGHYLDEFIVNGVTTAEKSYSKKTAIVTGAYTADGKEIYVELNAKRYIEQYFITVRDVTAMTNVLAIAEKTGRLNKEKNVMLVKLSNEFKSPIQSILGFSQALLDGMGGEFSEKQTKYIKIINKNSAELLHFMDKFLEFSQAESSLFQYEIKPFDLLNTIQTVVKNNENILSAKNLTLNIDADEFNKQAIYNDENVIKLILQNVLETSIKLTDAGFITIKIDNPEIDIVERSGAKLAPNATKQSYARILISDTGMGLAEGELNGIFEPYTQIEQGRKKTILRSFALGTANTILKRMGGAINIQSIIMQGTTFEIILPIEKTN